MVALVLEAGGSEPEVIGALLHDTVEDPRADVEIVIDLGKHLLYNMNEQKIIHS